MAKPIPSGGKRERQVKVNFNDLELARLDIYSRKIGSDKASILRNNFFSFIHIHDEVSGILKELEVSQRSANKTNIAFQQSCFDTSIRELSQISDTLNSFFKKNLHSKQDKSNLEKFKEVTGQTINRVDSVIRKIINKRERMRIDEMIRTKEVTKFIVRLEELFSNPEFLAKKTLDNLDDLTVNHRQEIILITITRTEHVYKVLDVLRDGLPILVDFSKIESDDLISLILENLKVGSYALSSDHYLLSNNLIFFLPKGIDLNHMNFSEDTKPKVPTLGQAVSGTIKSSRRIVGRGLEGLGKAIATEGQRKFWSGEESLQQEDYIGAIKDFSSAIKLDPDYEEAFLLRGKVKDKLEDYQGAIKDFSSAIELNPDYEEAFLLREKAKEKMKDKKLEKDTSTEKTLQDNAKERLSKVKQAAKKAKEKDEKLYKNKLAERQEKLKNAEKFQFDFKVSANGDTYIHDHQTTEIEMLKSRPPNKSKASVPQKNAKELRRRKPSKSYDQLKKEIL